MLNPLKTEMSQLLGLSKDALHIHFGLLILVACALVLRRSLGSVVPWLCVLLIELGNEYLDYSRWHGAADYSVVESLKDLLNTMFWPTVVVLVVRSGWLGRKIQTKPDEI